MRLKSWLKHIRLTICDCSLTGWHVTLSAPSCWCGLPASHVALRLTAAPARQRQAAFRGSLVALPLLCTAFFPPSGGSRPPRCPLLWGLGLPTGLWGGLHPARATQLTPADQQKGSTGLQLSARAGRWVPICRRVHSVGAIMRLRLSFVF